MPRVDWEHGAAGASRGFAGRRAECALFDRWQDAVKAGRGGALVVVGEPGIGKSALLDHMAWTAVGFHVVRAAGVEAEAELPFGGLHQVCAPFLATLEHMPGPQQDALAAAFGLRTGTAPDRLMLSLAVLGLLSEAAARQPLICVIDDAQWLDPGSAQALTFVAHRVGAEPLGLVFATRRAGGGLRGLQEVVLTGLGPGDARALLHSALHVPLDEVVVERIAAEARGSPLALLELPRTMTAAGFAGGFGPTDTAAVPGRIEESFRSRVLRLPAATRMLLLVAAAEPTGDAALLWRAAARLGIGGSAAAAAEADGLLSIGTRVVFRHPLVRSAVYHAVPPSQRRAAHRALADVTGPSEPDRRAWHRAQAAVGFDEEAAAELEGRRTGPWHVVVSLPPGHSWSGRSRSPPTPPPGRNGRCVRHAPSSRPARTTALSASSRWPTGGPRTSCGPPTASCCEDRSPSPAVSAVEPPPCCCARPADSSPSTPPVRGMSICKPWPLRCSRAAR
ncbi:AAA family ATPase [Streptomyces kaempferi]